MYEDVAKKDKNMTSNMMNKTHTGFIKFRTHSSLQDSGVKPFPHKKAKKGELIVMPKQMLSPPPTVPKVETDKIYSAVN